MKQNTEQTLECAQITPITLNVLKKLKKNHNSKQTQEFLNESFHHEAHFYTTYFEEFMESLMTFSHYISEVELEKNEKIQSILSLYQAKIFDDIEENIPSSCEFNLNQMKILQSKIGVYQLFMQQMKNVFKSFYLNNYYQQRQNHIFRKLFQFSSHLKVASEKNVNFLLFHEFILKITQSNNNYIGKM